MSSRAPPVELDFLGLRAAAPSEQHGKSTGSSSSLSSIRGMETSAIARIDPQLLRRVVVARSPATTEEAPAAPRPMTVFYNGSVAVFAVSHHTVIITARVRVRLRLASSRPRQAPRAPPSPVTVFYNGSVAVFDVSHHKGNHPQDEGAEYSGEETVREGDGLEMMVERWRRMGRLMRKMV
uniref:Tify domain-containing protein n=1 Tax=Aegilops tauschii TaxID=37682 RepID=M8CYM6_AEGTA